MVDISELGASFASGFTGVMPSIMKGLGYVVWGVIIIGGMWLGYILLQYKYKYM